MVICCPLVQRHKRTNYSYKMLVSLLHQANICRLLIKPTTNKLDVTSCVSHAFPPSYRSTWFSFLGPPLQTGACMLATKQNNIVVSVTQQETVKKHTYAINTMHSKGPLDYVLHCLFCCCHLWVTASCPPAPPPCPPPGCLGRPSAKSSHCAWK